MSLDRKIKYITAQDLKKILWGEEVYSLIDVRSQKEYEGGQIIQNTDDALLVNGADYVLVDDGDGRAEIVAFWLKELAIPNVKILSGGINEWLAKGYDLVSGSTVLAIDTGAHHEGALIRDPIIEANNYIE